MAIRNDFLEVNPNGDLLIQNGDFVTGPSDQQHVSDIITAFPGWWKEYPQLGVGLFAYYGSDGQGQQLVSSVSTQLTGDGYQSDPATKYQPDGTYLIWPNATINQQ
jgi:hypothetical protein